MSLSEELRRIDRDTATSAMFSTLVGILDDPKYAKDQYVNSAQYNAFIGFILGYKAAKEIIDTTHPVSPDYLKGLSAGIDISMFALFSIAAQAEKPN